MPSATAAARSETPSFSYRLCRWVLTVAALRCSWPAMSGAEAPVASSPRISPSRGRQQRVLDRRGGAVARRPCRLARRPRGTGPAGGDAADGVADLAAIGVLGDVAGRAEAEALVHLLPRDAHREDEHRAGEPRLPAPQAPPGRPCPGIRRSSTATSGDRADRPAPRAVAAGGHQLEVARALDRRRQPVEIHGMVVGDEHSGRPRRAIAPASSTTGRSSANPGCDPPAATTIPRRVGASSVRVRAPSGGRSTRRQAPDSGGHPGDRLCRDGGGVQAGGLATRAARARPHGRARRGRRGIGGGTPDPALRRPAGADDDHGPARARRRRWRPRPCPR